MVQKIKEILPKYSSGEIGVAPITEEIKLDEWNDRASGDYAIWAVENGKCVKVGLWRPLGF